MLRWIFDLSWKLWVLVLISLTVGVNVPSAAHAAPEIVVRVGLFIVLSGDTTPRLLDGTDIGDVALSPTNTTGSSDFGIQNLGTTQLDVTNVTSSNPLFTVSGAPTAVAAGGIETFTVTFDPAAVGQQTATITISNNDADENPYTFAIQGVGDAGPTVTVDIVDASLNDADNSSVANFTFSEAVNGFTESDLTVAGGSISEFNFTNGNTSGTATFTADDNSTVAGSVSVNANSYTDVAGLNGSSGNDTVTINTVNPTVTVNVVDASLNDADDSSSVTFTFSEAVDGFTQADLTLLGGTISAFSFTDGNTSGSATFTATDNSTTGGAVTVNPNSYTNTAGGNNGAAGNDSVTINTVNPSVTINIVDTDLNDADNSSNVTFTFSEATTDFVMGDLVVLNGSITGLTGSGTSYSATFNAFDGVSGTGTVTLFAGRYTNATGNDGTTGTDTVNIDRVNPTVTVNIVDANLNDADNESVVKFTFSEATTDFVFTDISTTNGTLSAFSGSGTSYTATFTAINNFTGNGTVSVNANSYTNAAGNAGTVGNDTVVIDTLDASVSSITRQNPAAATTNADTLVFRVTFSEAVTGVDAADFVATGTTGGPSAVAAVSTTVYDVTVSGGDLATVNGTVGLDMASATPAIIAPSGRDVLGTEPTTDETYTMANDIVPPSISSITAPGSHDNATPFTVTVVFSETLQGGTFTVGDLTIGGGTPSAFTTTDNQTFTFTVTPSGAADVTIDIAAGVTEDLAGNLNTAATKVTVSSSIVEETQKVIANFMTNRASHILNNQPDMIGFVTGQNKQGGGPLGFLAFNGNEDSQTLYFSTSRSKVLSGMQGYESAQRIDKAFSQSNATTPSSESETDDESNLLGFAAGNSIKEASTTYNLDAVQESGQIGNNRSGTWDFWTELYGSRSRSGNSNSTLWVGYVGAHYFIDNENIAGIFGQVDWADETDASTGSDADGIGWMIGPYIAGKFTDQNLFYEARVSYGMSSNNVSPIGTFTDSFDTTRLMAFGKLSGQYQRDNILITPEISIAWYEETQESYVDSLANTIPEQTISLGELRFGPEIQTTVVLDDGKLFKPSLGISGVYNFDVADNNASQGTPLGEEQLRARVDVGFTTTDPTTGTIFGFDGFYDGIGVVDYYTYGGRAKVTIPLN